ncbi:hypothetical protein BFW86_24320 [Pseudomonas fluorescens]|nr:hypothetical protein BFW86_24320 [Pseudomonas fluorescens]
MYKFFIAAVVSAFLIVYSVDDNVLSSPTAERLQSGMTTVPEIEKALGPPVSTMQSTDGTIRYQWIFKQSGFSGSEPQLKVLAATVNRDGVLGQFAVNDLTK